MRFVSWGLYRVHHVHDVCMSSRRLAEWNWSISGAAGTGRYRSCEGTIAALYCHRCKTAAMLASPGRSSRLGRTKARGIP
jgi:hypothetical protein